jgi:U3 small nucleolar RNA-associated protein 12
VWNLSSGELDFSLNGHRGAVTALRFDSAGGLLASGAADTDVVVWDVVAESGLFRLRGHTDQVNDLVFLSADAASGAKLVTASKDELVKVWDLDTQHCCQTVAGHRGEVWTIDVDPKEERVATGAADGELRLFRVVGSRGRGGETGELNVEEVKEVLQPGQVLVSMGSVRRQSTDRAALVRFCKSRSGLLLACQAAGKLLEVFRIRSEAEAQRHLKRRRKRRREKQQKQQKQRDAENGAAGATAGAWDDPAGTGEEVDTLIAADELEPLAAVRCKHKLRSFAFVPGEPSGSRRSVGGQPLASRLVLALANNSLEVWDAGDEGAVERAAALDAGGHRSDVRAVALSSDDALCLSGSNAGIKVWNPRTGACLRSVDSGYALCAMFAPGNRHAVVGSKEGTLEIIDIAASARVAVVEAHTGAIWCASVYSIVLSSVYLV